MANFTYTMGEKVHEAAGASRLGNILGNCIWFHKYWPSDFGSGANFPLEVRAADQKPFDFTGQRPAHESVGCLVYITNIGGTSHTFNIKWEWYNPDGNKTFTADIDVTASTETWALCFIGFFTDTEITESGQYSVDITITGDLSDTHTETFNCNNVTDPNNYIVGDSGYMWVEGTDIHFLDHLGYEHILENNILISSASHTPGYIWVEDTRTPVNALYYIDDNGDIRRTRVGYFDDTHAGSHTSLTPGYIWIQEPVSGGTWHWDKLSFIANDGKRYQLHDGIRDDC